MSRRESLSSLGRRWNVSYKTLAKWRRDGADIWDDAVMADLAAGKRSGGEDRQPEPPGVVLPPDGESYNEARTRKERAAADRIEIEVAKARGELVSAESVLSTGMRVGLAIRQAFLKMESELTPRVTGLPSGKVAKAVRAYAREKLTELRDLEYLNLENDNGNE